MTHPVEQKAGESGELERLRQAIRNRLSDCSTVDFYGISDEGIDNLALLAAQAVGAVPVGGEGTGAVLTDTGSQASPEAPTDPRPTGVDPSRKWLRIRSAPKDGTMLLLWSSSPIHADYYIGRYEAGESGAWHADAGWFADDGSDIHPTHWMPLPLPPALGTEAGTAKTEGLGPKDEGPATSVATPDPDPITKAQAVLDGETAPDRLVAWLEARIEAAYADANAHPPASGNRAFYTGQAIAYENAESALRDFEALSTLRSHQVNTGEGR